MLRDYKAGKEERDGRGISEKKLVAYDKILGEMSRTENYISIMLIFL